MLIPTLMALARMYCVIHITFPIFIPVYLVSMHRPTQRAMVLQVICCHTLQGNTIMQTHTKSSGAGGNTLLHNSKTLQRMVVVATVTLSAHLP